MRDDVLQQTRGTRAHSVVAGRLSSHPTPRMAECLPPLFRHSHLAQRADLPAREDRTVWYRILAGKVLVRSSTARHRGIVIDILGPGDQYLDFPAAEFGALSVCALTPATVAELPTSTFFELASVRSDVARCALAVLAARLRATGAALDDAMFLDVPARIAKKVLVLIERFGTRAGNSGYVAHDLTQQDLADLIGCSREAVNKAFAKFDARGWLSQSDRTIHVRDWQQLHRRAGRLNHVAAHPDASSATRFPIGASRHRPRQGRY